MVRRTVVLSPPTTVLGRLVWALATVVVLALGFFLLTAGFVVALVLAAVAALRIWWNGRRVRQATEARRGELLEVDYTVEDGPTRTLP